MPSTAYNPAANASAVVQHTLGGLPLRITLLGPGLLRLQLPSDLPAPTTTTNTNTTNTTNTTTFDERASFQVVNRLLPVPAFASRQPNSTSIAVSTRDLSLEAAVASADQPASLTIRITCNAQDGGTSSSSSSSSSFFWAPYNASVPVPPVAAMPINTAGFYVLNDTLTARLSSGPVRGSLPWWEWPLGMHPPQPAPKPANACAPGQLQLGVDVGPGATRSPAAPDGLAVAALADCCAACNRDPACISFTFASASSPLPSAPTPTTTQPPPPPPPPTQSNCWLFSAVRTLQPRENRTYGGSDPSSANATGRPTSLDVYAMCYGNDSLRGLQQLTAITGAAPLMPRAAYGVWYSGCCIPELYTQAAVDSLLAEYRTRNLPLSVLVLDFFWHRRDLNPWSSYSWDRERFPQPEALVAGLRSGNNSYGAPLKLLLNHHPNNYQVGPWETRYAAFAQAMGADPAGNATFPCAFYNASFMAALQSTLLDPIEDYPWLDCASCDVHGSCGDAAAPANLDINLLANYAFDRQITASGRRSLVLNRLPGLGNGTNYNDQPLSGRLLEGNLGAHRYPGAWTGDIGPDAGRLAASIALVPAAAAGHLWVAYSVDLGPYLTPDPVRFVRFVQWGVFSPIFRPHDGGNQDTRIWTFGEPVYTILHAYTQLRGALHAHIYSNALRTYNESWPAIRPMWFDYAPAPTAEALQGQYLFGDSLLVQPVARWDINSTVLATWVPPGRWTAWDGSRTVDGPQWINTSVGLGDIVVLAKAGAMLPLDLEVLQHPAATPDPMATRHTWVFWRGAAAGAGQLLDDGGDGDSLDYQTQPWRQDTAAYRVHERDLEGGGSVLVRVVLSAPGHVQLRGWAPEQLRSARAALLTSSLEWEDVEVQVGEGEGEGEGTTNWLLFPRGSLTTGRSQIARSSSLPAYRVFEFVFRAPSHGD